MTLSRPRGGTGPPDEERPGATSTGPTHQLTHQEPPQDGQWCQSISTEPEPSPSRVWRNPIRRIGDGPTRDYTKLPNDLLRQAIPAIGVDGFAVLALLLTHEDGWETSAVEIAQRLGWRQNQKRARAALGKLVDDRRLIIRNHRRHGGGLVHQEYIIRADASRFSDRDIEKWSQQITVIGGRGKRKRPGQ